MGKETSTGSVIEKKTDWGVVEFWARRGTGRFGWSTTRFYQTKKEAQRKLRAKLGLTEYDYELQRWLVQVVRRKNS